jgi:hypothetical protein
MKKIFVIILLFLTNLIFSQDVLDTLFFVDGKVEAVQITGLTETTVQYNYYGEGISIETPKSRLAKVITRSGRVVVFENTSQQKTVFTCEDWTKVEVTKIESEIEGLIRMANVSGKAKASGFGTLAKMQDRAMTKMRMQAAFLGCDVVFMLNQTNTDAGFYQSPGSFMTGTAYSVKRVTPFLIKNGDYFLTKVYRLKPNEFELYEISKRPYAQSIFIDNNNFFKDEDYYALNFNSKIPDSQNKMKLLKVTDDTLVFLVIDRSKQSKIKFYNLFFTKK